MSADVNADYVVDKSCKKEIIIVTQESAEHVKGYFVVIESIVLARQGCPVSSCFPKCVAFEVEKKKPKLIR